MYDIRFFRKIGAFKQRILSKECGSISDAQVAGEFEKYRNPKPFLFNFETTNNCNMSCIMCPRTNLMTRKITRISDDDFLRVLEQIRPQKPSELEKFWKYISKEYGINRSQRSENAFYFYVVSRCLTLHGYGEPMIDPNIVKHVRSCKQLNIPTYFSCVPANIRTDKVIELMEAGLDVIKFSIDSLSDEDQKKIRGRNNNFTKAFNSIKDILEYKKKNPSLKTKIVITMVALGNNPEDIEMQKQFLALWEEFPVYAYVKSQDNRWYFEDDADLENQSHYETQYCEFPWTSLSIMSNGVVVPCSQDYDAEMAMGHIREQSLDEIWNGEKYKEFRNSHISGQFSKEYKCKDRCDLPKLYQRLKR